jgi:hypothetical protein
MKTWSLMFWAPGSIWESASVAALIGLLILLITITARRHDLSWKEYFRQLRLRDLARDIGIGFLVAAVVSVAYESSTRSVAEKEKGVDIIDNLMSSFLGENVWKEVRGEVVRTPVLRRNHVIKIALLRNGTLPGGQSISFPKCRALLRFESGYDLYRLTPESTPAVIQQTLNYEMWNDELQLPRFEWVKIFTLDNFLQQKETRRYEGEALKKLEDGRGSIRLQGKDAIDLPEPGENKPIRVVTQRYEIVSTPGQYNLVIPVLTTRLESEPHTITIIVEDHPDDIDIVVETFWSGHQFTHSDTKTWVFDGIMLPGQGLTITLKVSPDKQGLPQKPCD